MSGNRPPTVPGPIGVRAALVCALVCTTTAHAEPGLHAHAEADEPLLHVDPDLVPAFVPLGVAVVDDRAAIDLSPRAAVERDATTWSDPVFDTRGWQLRLRLAYELGGDMQLGITAGLGGIESRFVSGPYYDAGIAITKLFFLSRWTTGFVSLGAGYRISPDRLIGGGSVMLRAGVTFR